MKRIYDFLKLQKEVEAGLTEKDIKKKVDYIQGLKEDFEREPTDIKIRILDRERGKAFEEIKPHKIKRKKLNEELKFFAGQITPTEFKLKKAKQLKSKESIREYLDKKSEWEEEIFSIIKLHTVNEILEVYIVKERKAIEKRIEVIKKEVQTLTHDLGDLNKLSDYLVMHTDVQNFNSNKKTITDKKVFKR